MQLRNLIGEATLFIITIFTNTIEESDKGSNCYFFSLLYLQMQLRNLIGEAFVSLIDLILNESVPSLSGVKHSTTEPLRL